MQFHIRTSTRRACRGRLFALVTSAAMLLSLCSFTGSAQVPGAMEGTARLIAVSSVPDNIRALLGDTTGLAGIVPGDDLYSLTTESTDGTGTLEQYSAPIRYVDKNGDAKFIDTSMVEKSRAAALFSGYDYENAANSFTVEFSAHPGKGMRLNGEFTVAIDHPASSTLSRATRTGYVEQESDGADRMVYPQAFGAGTRVEYRNTSNGVKEEIILERNVGRNTFDFRFRSDRYDLALSEDGTAIYVVDKTFEGDRSDPANAAYIVNPL